MTSNHSKLYTIPFPSGRTVMKLSGRHVFIIDSTTVLGVKIGDMPENNLLPGQGVSLERPDEFDRLEINNPTTATVTVQLWIGHVAFVDFRKTVIEQPTRFAAWSGTQLPATTGQTFTGAVTVTGDVRRKAIIVSNEDPAANLYLRDASGNTGHTIFPLTSIILPISGHVEVYNSGGAAVSCRIAEIWWTN